MSTDHQELVLRSLTAALQSKKLYPPGHPSVAAPARKAFQVLTPAIKETPKLTIGMVEEALVYNETPVAEAEENYIDIIEQMKHKDLEAMTFEKGTTEKEVVDFLNILSLEPAPNDIQKELTNKGISHITVKTVVKNKSILEVYNEAVDTIKNVMGELRLGKIPKSDAVNHVVDDLTDKILTDSNAMVGLTMIKNYDDYLYNHSVNVGILSLSLAKHMQLGEEDLHTVGVASILHDVGKTGVSEDIIKKPGSLSSEEWEKVKEHPVLGSKITKRMDNLSDTVCRVILEHHVRYDKSGYPPVEEDIHPLSIIVSVADAYDALTTLRVYQKPYQPIEAIKILKGLAGKHFDAKTIEAFESMIGVYPLGTLLRLSTNEVGVVTKTNPDAHDRPEIKILFAPDGEKVEDPQILDLATPEASETLVIGSVDPMARNMDMGEFYTNEAIAAEEAEAKK